MGGFGSGRYGGRVTVEGGLTLDVCAMIRRGQMKPGQHVRGTLTWTRVRDSERIGSISYEANLCDPSEAGLRLFYAITPSGGGEPVHRDYRVTLDTTRPPFGGLRWWFLCPSTGRQVVKLYLPNGGTIFAARRAYPLVYQSQRNAALERGHARQGRIFAKLGAEYRCFEDPPPRKPKWMRWRTHNRLCAELVAAEAAHEAIFAAGAVRFLARESRLSRRGKTHGTR